MSWLSLSRVAGLLGETFSGPDVQLSGVSTDTRTPLDGKLFIALQGPNFDAHAVLEQGLKDLPAGLLVSRRIAMDVPQIIVDDTRKALGALAKAWRRECDVTVIGLTGSNGKTTVKEMLAEIFGSIGKTLATAGNLNNDIGVPLTLLRLRQEHDYAVIEMGANHVGEIAYLTDLVSPDIALLNNANAAHLEGFGSLDNVIQAKGEIFSGLKPDGVAVLNADSPAFHVWREMVSAYQLQTFGFAETADCQIVETTPYLLRCGDQSYELPLALPGRHNQMNAAAAAACALAAGLPFSAVIEGIGRVRPVAGRLCTHRHPSGAAIIDDSYNANPASMQAAIDTLAAMAGTRILIVGDMAELGSEGGDAHADVGRAAKAAQINGFCAIGRESRAAADAFGPSARHFDDIGALCAHLSAWLQDGVTMLVKGSRSAGMERVVNGLMDRATDPQEDCPYAA